MFCQTSESIKEFIKVSNVISKLETKIGVVSVSFPHPRHYLTEFCEVAFSLYSEISIALSVVVSHVPFASGPV